jgi:hypothetical protein
MSEAPGWDAIDQALNAVYGEQEPLHYGTVVKWAMGGPDPLDGVSTYKNRSPLWHWHYVSYGLTELYKKESATADTSGYGFELTFRLACAAGDDQPPIWPINLMQNLARYVFETGRVFAAGHHIDCNGPIALEETTDLTAILFTTDPKLGELDTANGHMRFLQFVGITADELDATQEWDTHGLAEVLAADNPLLATDLQRVSLLHDPDKRKVIQDRTEKDGSACGSLSNDSSKWRVREDGQGSNLELSLGAAMVTRLARLLRGRILHGREFRLESEYGTVIIKPGRRASWKVKADDELVLALTPELARQMQAELAPRRGTYAWPGLANFTLKVVPTKIKDQDGNVTEVVG